MNFGADNWLAFKRVTIDQIILYQHRKYARQPSTISFIDINQVDLYVEPVYVRRSSEHPGEPDEFEGLHGDNWMEQVDGHHHPGDETRCRSVSGQSKERHF